jgi:hypothetical protein
MSWLKKIIYNCKQATFLIEKRSQGKISFSEEVELRIHLIGCGVCKLYKKQSRMINNMVQQLFVDSVKKNYKLDDDFKKALQDKIEEELNK